MTIDLRGGTDSTHLSRIRAPETQDRPIIVHGGRGRRAGHDRLYGNGRAESLNGGIDEDLLYRAVNDAALVDGGGVDRLTFEALAGTMTPTN